MRLYEPEARLLIHWFSSPSCSTLRAGSQPSSSFGAASRQSLTCIAPDAAPFGPTSGCSSFSPPLRAVRLYELEAWLSVLDLPKVSIHPLDPAGPGSRPSARGIPSPYSTGPQHHQERFARETQAQRISPACRQHAEEWPEIHHPRPMELF
jgi:hypothetical protein